MRGLNPLYLDKLDPVQRKWILTMAGKKFFDHFVAEKGYHCFVVGNTGSGKTQKNYWLMNFLMHTENQIWISTGKNDEILPLLCFGKPVQIIIPKGCTITIEQRDAITKKYRLIDNHPKVVEVSDPGDVWWAVKKGHINILEFRNSFWTKEALTKWMSEMFELLATWTRLRRMPAIFPCSIYIDEAQWTLAGTRISTMKSRVKTSEIITENILELRSAGCRFILSAQSYRNITPAARENMICAILCRGALVDRSENPQLSSHCTSHKGQIPATFKPKEGKFIYADGTSNPWYYPWKFRQFPRDVEDRRWIESIRVTYKNFFDLPKEIEVKPLQPSPVIEEGKNKIDLQTDPSPYSSGSITDVDMH